MVLKKIVLVLLSVALLGCSAVLPPAQTATPAMAKAGDQPDLKSLYAKLAKEGGVYTLDPAASSVRIYVFRGGTAAKMGHNHVLSAPQFTGFVHVPPDGGGARFDLEFRLDQLEFDDPQYRSRLGGAFASKISPEAIPATRDHMLSPDNMEAERFPTVRIHSLAITGEAPKFAAKVLIAMHGQKREQWVPLTVEGLPQRIAVTGAFVVRQTEFGVQPYSVLNGMLAVRDEIVVEFNLLGNPAG